MTETKKRITRTAKDPRINLALQPDLYDFIVTMAGLRGESVTEYLNQLIAANREKNLDTYQAAKALAEKTTLE